MNSPLLASRRLLGIASAAVVAATMATAGASGADASPAPRGKKPTVTTAPATAAEGDDSPVPAPPRPPVTRPTPHLVSKSTSPRLRGTATATAAVTASGTGAPGASTARTLILYDSTGDWGWLGEAYAVQTAHLASHLSAWNAHPVATYTAGELASYSSVIYIGSTYDEPIPVAFLDDVTTTTKPVLWMYDNIWQLTARDTTFAATRGFTWTQFDFSSVAQVTYKGTALTRDTADTAGIMNETVTDATKASVLASAVRADGTTFPWAVRSRNFTYVGEIPFAYMTSDDRYLAAADILFDVLNPTAATRHRALVRIEDVGPDSDPAELRAVADYLNAQKVPFSVAVYPRYRDPHGTYSGGVAQDYTLAQRPAVISALKYMTARGGTLIMHGYTHQYGTVANPYNGVSGDDFEFYRAHVDAGDNVVYDGPTAEDSTAWATGRIQSSSAGFRAAGLAVPTTFEFPHYAGSAVDYQVVNTMMSTRYDRGVYFPGVLTHTTVDYTRLFGQFFPYTVRDVYGTVLIPENLGNVEPEAFNNHPPRLPADILASARRNLVIRDSTASFFYHPYLGTAYLRPIVTGIKSLGYTFVSAATVRAG